MTPDDLQLLTAACSDATNARAQELLNVLGTASGPEIASQIASLPTELRVDLEKHVREAINEHKRRVRPR